jgi:hypothetical protein
VAMAFAAWGVVLRVAADKPAAALTVTLLD